MTDQRLREEIEQLIERWRERARSHYRIARLAAKSQAFEDERCSLALATNECADDLASLLARVGESGTPAKTKTLDRNGRSGRVYSRRLKPRRKD